MKPRTYIRLLLVTLIVSVSFFLFAYSHKTTAPVEKNVDCNGKINDNCVEKKAQTEFILLESISRNLLSLNH